MIGELQASITDEHRAEWLASDAVAWANESVAIAREPNVGYCVMIDDACKCAAGNRDFDEGEPAKVVVIDDGYLDRHAPVVRERIVRAGVRLAGLLNRALGDQRPETNVRAELLARIEAISREPRGAEGSGRIDRRAVVRSGPAGT